MSDPPPTAPKVGSLRDRIRQFDQKPATPESATAPSAPRGKLGQWKPKPIERQEHAKQDEPVIVSQAVENDDNTETAAPERGGSGGMSAADARASISKGGGLTMKERMAALAAASPSPPPVPVATKPAPKRQPLNLPVVSPDEDAIEPEGDEDDDNALTGGVPAVSETEEQADQADESTEQVETDKTEEEVERERRAAIAARMARLGGTRVGMGPAFGRPPVPPGPKPARKESHDSKVEDRTSASNSVTPAEDASPPDSILDESRAAKQSRPSIEVPAVALLSPPEDTATVETARSPSLSPSLSPSAAPSMPIPAVPRRALPPRKKAKTPAASPKSDEPLQGLEHGLSHATPNEEHADGDSVKLASEEPSRANSVAADEAIAPSANTSYEPIDDATEPNTGLTEGARTDALGQSLDDEEEEEEEDEATRRARIAERLSKAGGRSVLSPPVPIAQRPTAKSTAVPESTGASESDEDYEPNSQVAEDLRTEDDGWLSEDETSRRIREEDGTRRQAPLAKAVGRGASSVQGTHDEAPRSIHEDNLREELEADQGEAARMNAGAPSPAAAPLLPARDPATRFTSSHQPISSHEQLEAESDDDVTGKPFESARELPSTFSPSASRLDHDHDHDSDGEGKQIESQLHQDLNPATAHEDSDSMVIGRIAQPPIRSTYSPTVSRANTLQGKTAATSPKDSRPTSPNEGSPRSLTRSGTIPPAGRAAPLPSPTFARPTSSVSRSLPSDTISPASVSDIADEEHDDDELARRRKITDRLSRMGGHNPYGPPAVPAALRPVRKPTTDTEPSLAGKEEHLAASSEADEFDDDDDMSDEQEDSAPPSPQRSLPSARPSTSSVGGTPSHPRAASQARPQSPPAIDEPPSPPTPPSPELSPAIPSNEPTPIGSQEVLSSAAQPDDPRPYHPPRVLRPVSPASASASPAASLAPPTRARPPVPSGPRPASGALSVPMTSKRASLPPTVPLPPVPSQRSAPQQRAARASMDSQSDGQLDVVDPGVTLSDGEQSPIVPKLSRLNAPLPPPPNENEVMSEDDGDPIDPSIHTPTRSTPGTPGLQTTQLPPSTLLTSSAPPSALVASPLSAAPATAGHGDADADEEEEPRSRPQTLAERMAKLGAVKMGGPPPIGAPPPPRQRKQTSEAAEGSEEPGAESQPQIQHADPSELDTADEAQEPEHEPTEEERRRAIVARLTAQGGLRPGMMQFGAPRPVSRRTEDDEELAQSPPHRSPPPLGRAPPVPQVAIARAPPVPTARAPPVPGSAPARAPPVPSSTHPPRSPRSPRSPPPPPPVPKTEPQHEEETALSYLDDGEEEEDDRRTNREEAEDDEQPDEVDDIPPPLPSPRAPKTTPPPLPPGRRTGLVPPVPGTAPGRIPPPPPRTIPPPPAPPTLGRDDSHVTSATQHDEFDEEGSTPPPPPPPRTYPPRSPNAASPAGHQRELPTVGRDSIDLAPGMGNSWDHEPYGAAARSPTSPHAPPRSLPPPPPPTTSLPPTARRKSLDSEELTDLSRRIGVRVLSSAQSLAAYAKSRVVGDGTSAGYVHAVLEGVPSAVQTETGEFGHAIYVQTGSAVQLRRSDIAPGDIVHVQNAQFSGRKVLKAYKEQVEDAYGVVMEFERKHGKIRVFKANQTANAYPAVEQHSWKLEDLKSGTLRVYRVAEAT